MTDTAANRDHDLGHKCGIFAIADHPDAAELAYYGLYALQHRGQESAGIAATIDGRIKTFVGMGLVGDVFQPEFFDQFKSARAAIGHTRYSTAGSSNVKNAQPITVDTGIGQISVAHNGNLTNGWQLREELEASGSIFQTTSDSEIILHLLARPEHGRQADPWPTVLRKLQGAFSYVALRNGAITGIRDPHGYRPLAIGRKDGAWVFASETCAFDMIGATHEGEVAPGEIVTATAKGLERRVYAAPDAPRAHCIFEHVYFARPDSLVFNQHVHTARIQMGRALARECPAPGAELVVPVPDSGNSAAQGFSLESHIPLEQGFVRNHYVGRSFIQPSQRDREMAVKIKLNANRPVIEGKSLVVVDDSIIRGTTSRSRVRRLREAGAREIHLRISCPPTRHPCYFGIDFPDPAELIANSKTIEQIRDYLGIESLGYLSVEGMTKAVANGRDFCTACFSGEYRTAKADGFTKLKCG
jgi:amidophosphoribosyltransferase